MIFIKEGTFWTILFFLSPVWLYAQLEGKVTDNKGEELPFTTIYIEGTTIGTSANENGYYKLDIPTGEHHIIFQHIGYDPEKRIVNAEELEILNISLSPSEFSLDEVTIVADENPAIPIIKKTIEKRDFYRKSIKKYKAKLYAKGMVKMLETPEKVLGEEIGTLEGILDSTGQGIVYLSESLSDIIYEYPDRIKEIMHSSKVAEGESGFTANMLSNVYFNVNDEYYEFNRTVMSPIADNALMNYDYELEGVSIGKNGRLINKIKVIPSSKNRPLFFGHLYIEEDTWRTTEVSLCLTGKAVQTYFFDTITIAQVLLPISDEQYAVFHQQMSFGAGLFGFKMKGEFTHIFSDYDLNVMLDKELKNDSEVFRLLEDSEEKEVDYWNEHRPIPLTETETKEYVRKDSLTKLWSSEEYRDSIDRVENRFSWSDIFFGYEFNKSFDYLTYSISSPLFSYRFNPVEGSSLSTNISMVKRNKERTKRFKGKLKLGYGFSDERVKAALNLEYRTNRINNETFHLSLADDYFEFNSKKPVPKPIATYAALFYKKNYLRLYQARRLRLGYMRELKNGLWGFSSVLTGKRTPLFINSHYSFFDKEELYESNNPVEPNNYSDAFDEHYFTEIRVGFLIRPFQKYNSYGKYRERIRSNWPDIRITYRKALKDVYDGQNTDFDKLNIVIEDRYLNLKMFGHLSYHLDAGTFLSDNRSYMMDFNHFYSNESIFGASDNYYRAFKLMPHYDYSTSNDYLNVHLSHHWDGYVLDRIPILNRIGTGLVIEAKSLLRESQDNYYEFSIGLEGIGFSVFRILRLDYAWSLDDGGLLDRGVIIGTSLGFGD